MPSSNNRLNSRTMLLVATAIVVVCMLIPYGEYVVYPFRLFNTFVHEAGHALATVVTGGTVQEMVVNWDTSGHVDAQGRYNIPLVASAGYMGSILLGALLLFLGSRRKWVRPTLLGLGAAILVVTALFGGAGQPLIAVAGFGLGGSLLALGRVQARRGNASAHTNALGGGFLIATVGYLIWTNALLVWIIGVLIGAGVLAVAAYAKPVVQHLTVLFLGVQLAVQGIDSVQVLLNVTTSGHGHNDAQIMADHTGLPATFWALTWGLMGVVIIAGAFWLFWRQETSPKQ